VTNHIASIEISHAKTLEVVTLSACFGCLPNRPFMPASATVGSHFNAFARIDIAVSVLKLA
jgi:hypothetical protein